MRTRSFAKSFTRLTLHATIAGRSKLAVLRKYCLIYPPIRPIFPTASETWFRGPPRSGDLALPSPARHIDHRRTPWSYQDTHKDRTHHTNPLTRPATASPHPHHSLSIALVLIMLDLRPAFLPLQPLSQTQMKLGTALISPGGSISPLSLDNDSISDIRHSLRPFPLLALQQRKLEFVSLGHAEDGEDEPEERLARELVVRPMKRADVERVRELQVRRHTACFVREDTADNNSVVTGRFTPRLVPSVVLHRPPHEPLLALPRRLSPL